MYRLPVVLLMCTIARVTGRPTQQKETTTDGEPSRHYQETTGLTGGVIPQQNKLQLGAQTTTNYLSKLRSNKVLRLRRRGKALAASPLDKILSKLSSTSQMRSDAKVNTGIADRCGVQDTGNVKPRPRFALPSKLRRRFRRYVTQGSKWPLTTITWSVNPNNWSSKMTKTEVIDTLTKAFRTWAEVIPLVFRFQTDFQSAVIKIGFHKGYHGCQLYFDGPHGILAHAYFPQYGGAIHFDDDEPWKPDTTDKNYRSLLKVAIHEIGHSLGLQHSNVAGAMMGKLYLNSWSTALDDDDIKGIQSLYGLCEPTKLDSIESSFMLGKTYMFKNDLYWKYNDIMNRTQLPGYPRSIKTGWPGLPSKIDEMFLWRRNMGLYFFAGKYYYRYDEQVDRVAGGYPKAISAGWPGVPDDIDAALSHDKYSYFFKGDLSYKYDNQLDRVVQVEKLSVAWPLVPDNIDSAFVWIYDGFTYFVKDDYYWRWDPVNYRGVGPKRIKEFWRNLCDV